jgi:hypothetical protein
MSTSDENGSMLGAIKHAAESLAEKYWIASYQLLFLPFSIDFLSHIYDQCISS